MEEQLDHEEAFPRLSRELVAVLDAAGERRALVEGEVLNRVGEVAREFYVVVRRRVRAIPLSSSGAPTRRARHCAMS